MTKGAAPGTLSIVEDIMRGIGLLVWLLLGGCNTQAPSDVEVLPTVTFPGAEVSQPDLGGVPETLRAAQPDLGRAADLASVRDLAQVPAVVEDLGRAADALSSEDLLPAATECPGGQVRLERAIACREVLETSCAPYPGSCGSVGQGCCDAAGRPKSLGGFCGPGKACVSGMCRGCPPQARPF